MCYNNDSSFGFDVISHCMNNSLKDTNIRNSELTFKLMFLFFIFCELISNIETWKYLP